MDYDHRNSKNDKSKNNRPATEPMGQNKAETIYFMGISSLDSS